MENAQIVQKVVAVEVAFGTFLAILQVHPEESLALVDIHESRRLLTGFLSKIGRSASLCVKSFVLRPINGAVIRSVVQARVVKNKVKIGN